MNLKSLLRHLNLFILLVAVACHRDDPKPANPNEHVNNWIFENMDFWYYWQDEMPANPDKSLAPDAFFESLLSDKDRFSWIEENYQELLSMLQGVEKEPGYEYALYRESASNNNVIAQILYVKPNSPASAAGLERGDIINQINSQQITINNYQSLLGQLSSSHTISYKPLDINTKTFGVPQTASITPVEYAEDPNYLNKVFVYGNHRVGYYVLNFFANGTSASPEQYENEMDQVFSSFQAQGITDLIIDLRFNSGGAESTAQNLASLIGKDVNSTKLFVRHEYNPKVTEEIMSDPKLGESFLKVNFLDKAQNVGALIPNVYILTGRRTASASELIINGLRPFMSVILVGDTTVGKNLGSISIYDDKDPDNTWGMQPIVTKLVNSLNQSDYEAGFNPQFPDADNSIYLYPLGDPKEELLNIALEQITGSQVLGRIRDRREPRLGSLLGHSLDRKRRTGHVVLESPLPR
jgi:carboxyl-terminal processing protease